MKSNAILFTLAFFAGPALSTPATVGVCESTFDIVSWNLQVFGKVNPKRQAACATAYNAVISSRVLVMATQEIAHDRGLDTFLTLLPGGPTTWQASFQDTPDGQDNAILARVEVATITRQGFIFMNRNTGIPDRRKALHPIRWAHIRVGDFDFTLLSLHLTFKGGDAAASKHELFALLDWLNNYFEDPTTDPDVIIAGDFNLPSKKGKTLSKRHNVAKWAPLEDMIREHGKFSEGPHKLTVLVDDPTSRPTKNPQNNYDHFILSPSALQKFIAARRVPRDLVDQADAKIRERVSDHYPIEATFCSRGESIHLDSDYGGGAQ